MFAGWVCASFFGWSPCPPKCILVMKSETYWLFAYCWPGDLHRSGGKTLSLLCILIGLRRLCNILRQRRYSLQGSVLIFYDEKKTNNPNIIPQQLLVMCLVFLGQVCRVEMCFSNSPAQQFETCLNYFDLQKCLAAGAVDSELDDKPSNEHVLWKAGDRLRGDL